MSLTSGDTSARQPSRHSLHVGHARVSNAGGTFVTDAERNQEDFNEGLDFLRFRVAGSTEEGLTRSNLLTASSTDNGCSESGLPCTDFGLQVPFKM